MGLTNTFTPGKQVPGGSIFSDSRGFLWSRGNEENPDQIVSAGKFGTDEAGNDIFRQLMPDENSQGTPMGLPMGASRWSSGMELTPAEMQNVLQTLATGKFDGVPLGGLSLEQYLNDPRSAVRREGGKFIYRPEQQKDDFISQDRESFMSAFAPTLSAWTMFAAPIASSMGAAATAGNSATQAGTLKGGMSSFFNIPSTGNWLADQVTKFAVNNTIGQGVSQVLGPGYGTLANTAAGLAGGFSPTEAASTGSSTTPSFNFSTGDKMDDFSSWFNTSPVDLGNSGGNWFDTSQIDLGNSGGGFGGFNPADFLSNLASSPSFDFGPSSLGYENSFDLGQMSPMLMEGSSGGAGGFGLQDLFERLKKMPWKAGAGGLDIMKSLYGLMQANKLQQMAKGMQASADPYGPYRAQAAGKLNNLMMDPSSLADTPGYQAGLQAVQRGLAGSGYLGSGNEKVALLKYGGDAYNQQVQQLAQLAGAQFSPAQAAGIGLQGVGGAMNLRGNVLNNLARNMYNLGT